MVRLGVRVKCFVQDDSFNNLFYWDLFFNYYLFLDQYFLFNHNLLLNQNFFFHYNFDRNLNRNEHFSKYDNLFLNLNRYFDNNFFDIFRFTGVRFISLLLYIWRVFVLFETCLALFALHWLFFNLGKIFECRKHAFLWVKPTSLRLLTLIYHNIFYYLFLYYNFLPYYYLLLYNHLLSYYFLHLFHYFPLDVDRDLYDLFHPLFPQRWYLMLNFALMVWYLTLMVWYFVVLDLAIL